ncbi:MAG TPA: tetratricopeptide repeat protein [Vicinamibacteria bacterium]|nr:tetratricopeptide repeat protein [Vicinamibacteria bacterium]
MKRLLVAGGLVAAGLLLPAPAAWSQSTGAVRGKIVDEKGQPLPDAAVVIDFQGGVNRQLTTKTNKKGEFTQVGLSPGNYKITVNKEGYQGAFVETRVGLGEPLQLPEMKLVNRAAAQAAAGAEADKANAALRELFAKANQLSQEGKHDEAIAAYQQVLASNPQVAEAHYNIGFIQTQKKDWPASEAAFLKALEVRPGYVEATTALARVYQDSGQADKASALLAKAAADSPNDPKVQFNLGVFHLNAGRSDEASAAFQKAAEADPTNPEVYYYLGTLAVGQNNIPGATAHLEKYLAMKPTNEQNVATAQGLLQALKPKK